MEIKYEYKNNSLTCYLSGDIDHHSARFFSEGIDEIIDQKQTVNYLILDFSSVTFMDSSGVGITLGRFKKMKEQDGEVIIKNASPYIKRVFTLCAVDKLVKIV